LWLNEPLRPSARGLLPKGLSRQKGMTYSRLFLIVSLIFAPYISVLELRLRKSPSATFIEKHLLAPSSPKASACLHERPPSAKEKRTPVHRPRRRRCTGALSRTHLFALLACHSPVHLRLRRSPKARDSVQGALSRKRRVLERCAERLGARVTLSLGDTRDSVTREKRLRRSPKARDSVHRRFSSLRTESLAFGERDPATQTTCDRYMTTKIMCLPHEKSCFNCSWCFWLLERG